MSDRCAVCGSELIRSSPIISGYDNEGYPQTVFSYQCPNQESHFKARPCLYLASVEEKRRES